MTLESKEAEQKLATGLDFGMSGLKLAAGGLPMQQLADTGGLSFTNRKLLLVTKCE
jgi:hypothetical protein